jgi:hypothetical protein
MLALLSTARRVLLAPALVPLTLVAAGSSWLAVLLASEALGGDEGFVDEVRRACAPFAGALVLSLAEPLEVGREVREGWLVLRLARGGGFALLSRWAGLLLATLPTVLLSAWAAGGWPGGPAGAAGLLLELAVLCAGGLLLGAWLERALLVPALWCLFVGGHLWPWLAGSGASWVLPRLDGAAGATAWLSAAAWCAGSLLLARARLTVVAGAGG